MLEIIPSIEKAKLYDEDTLETLRNQAYIGLMNQAMSDGGSEGLRQWWKDQPRKVRNNHALQIELADHFIACDDNEQAQKIILDSLKHQYDEKLIKLMPKLKSGNPGPLEKELRFRPAVRHPPGAGRRGAGRSPGSAPRPSVRPHAANRGGLA